MLLLLQKNIIIFVMRKMTPTTISCRLNSLLISIRRSLQQPKLAEPMMFSMTQSLTLMMRKRSWARHMTYLKRSLSQPSPRWELSKARMSSEKSARKSPTTETASFFYSLLSTTYAAISPSSAGFCWLWSRASPQFVAFWSTPLLSKKVFANQLERYVERQPSLKL